MNSEALLTWGLRPSLLFSAYIYFSSALVNYRLIIATQYLLTQAPCQVNKCKKVSLILISIIYINLFSRNRHCTMNRHWCIYKSHMCIYVGQGVAQVVEHSHIKVGIIWSSLHGECICSLGYFPFQTVVHNWSIKGCDTWFPVYGKVHIKDPLLVIGKSSLCGDGEFCLKRYVTMTIRLMSNSQWYENKCALQMSLNKTNFPLYVCQVHATCSTWHHKYRIEP